MPPEDSPTTRRAGGRDLPLGELPLALPRGRPYLVGVSGGIDSVALLEALRAGGFSSPVVCHLDHGLRGRESTGDARFVARLAAAAGFRAILGKEDVRRRAAESGLSVETAAREARLAFFARAAAEVGTRTLFLAHHAGDQAETVLFHFLRGSGLAGLRGMRPLQRLRGLRVIRPLLCVTRAEIGAFAAARGLRFREDRTNAEPCAARNRLRHEVLPLLSEVMGRDVVPAILRLAELADAEDACLEALLPPAPARLPAESVRRLPLALARRLVKRWLAARGVADVGFDVVEAVRRLADPGGGRAKANLPRGWHARRRAGVLFVERG